MDTYWTRRWKVGWTTPVLVGVLLVLSGCAGPRGPGPTAASGRGAVGDETGFGEVLAAVARAKTALCAPGEGGAYIPLPPPPGPAAAAAAYFRYLEGRIYEFAPCELPSSRRNELRVFRYGERETRDSAIRDMAGRHSRPTASFAVGDAYEAQIWSPDPSLEGPVGQAAAAVHFALGRMEHARHLDVGP